MKKVEKEKSKRKVWIGSQRIQNLKTPETLKEEISILNSSGGGQVS